jgi:hypothetical protein
VTNLDARADNLARSSAGRGPADQEYHYDSMIGKNRPTCGTHLHAGRWSGSPGSSNEKTVAFNLSNEMNQTTQTSLALRHALQAL